jgi:hypothetical protein
VPSASAPTRPPTVEPLLDLLARTPHDPGRADRPRQIDHRRDNLRPFTHECEPISAAPFRPAVESAAGPPDGRERGASGRYGFHGGAQCASVIGRFERVRDVRFGR